MPSAVRFRRAPFSRLDNIWLLDPCVCALLRHVGSVLIEIGSAPRGCSSGDDDERGEMGGVSGVGNSAVERG